MLTIADRVKAWLASHPTHTNFLANGLINASALARTIQPDLQETNETVSLEAITLAVNRYSKHLQKTPLLNIDQFIGELSVQSGLSSITIAHDDLDPDTFSKAISILHKTHEYTLYTHGVSHTVLVGKQPVVEELMTHFRHISALHNLVAITIKLKPGSTDTPGIGALILQKIAYRGITLMHIASSHNELSIVINKKDTNNALDCLV